MSEILNFFVNLLSGDYYHRYIPPIDFGVDVDTFFGKRDREESYNTPNCQNSVVPAASSLLPPPPPPPPPPFSLAPAPTKLNLRKKSSDGERSPEISPKQKDFVGQLNDIFKAGKSVLRKTPVMKPNDDDVDAKLSLKNESEIGRPWQKSTPTCSPEKAGIFSSPEGILSSASTGSSTAGDIEDSPKVGSPMNGVWRKPSVRKEGDNNEDLSFSVKLRPVNRPISAEKNVMNSSCNNEMMEHIKNMRSKRKSNIYEEATSTAAGNDKLKPKLSYSDNAPIGGTETEDLESQDQDPSSRHDEEQTAVAVFSENGSSISPRRPVPRPRKKAVSTIQLDQNATLTSLDINSTSIFPPLR